MAEYLPLVMFAFLLVMIMLGFPVAFTLAGTAVIFGIIGFAFDIFYLSDFGFIPNRIWGVMTNYTLVAVPLFIFMGLTLEKSGVASDLLQTMSRVFYRIRGSLAFSIILVGALLAASTGIVGATVVTMGVLALPSMLDDGYDERLTCGVISASGTLGQIIPPSIVLVLLGDIMNQDVGDLFMGAVIPGVILVSSYAAYIFVLTRTKTHLFPLPAERSNQRPKLKEILSAVLPPVFLMVLVLGSIIFGVASPTEAASCGAFGALVVACFRRTISWRELQDVMRQTAAITAMVFTLLIAAQFFGVVFRGLYGDELIVGFIESSALSKNLTLIFIMTIIFVLGFFLDFLEICFIVLPVILPILRALEIDILWAAILFAVNLQTSFLTPPFGFALFYLRGVADRRVKTAQIYRGAVPFVAIQLGIMALLFLFPELVTWLPRALFGKL